MNNQSCRGCQTDDMYDGPGDDERRVTWAVALTLSRDSGTLFNFGVLFICGDSSLGNTGIRVNGQLGF